MASFPANVYGGGCNALHLRWAKAGTEIASSILDRRKGEERFTYGALVLPGNLFQPFLRGPMYDI